MKPSSSLVNTNSSSALLVVMIVISLSMTTISANRLLGVLLPTDYMHRLEDEQRQILDESGSASSSNNDKSGSLVVKPSPSGPPGTDHRFYMDRRSIQNCASSSGDEETLLSMDRLCEACHEMYRHRDPNIRANCRSNCFDNDDFVFCFNHFAGNVQVSRS